MAADLTDQHAPTFARALCAQVLKSDVASSYYAVTVNYGSDKLRGQRSDKPRRWCEAPASALKPNALDLTLKTQRMKILGSGTSQKAVK